MEFEAKVAQELGQFCTSQQKGRDGFWLAIDEDIEGSIAIDGARASEEGAHLRWFITSNALRGQGIGRQLLSRAIEFVDACRGRTAQTAITGDRIKRIPRDALFAEHWPRAESAERSGRAARRSLAARPADCG